MKIYFFTKNVFFSFSSFVFLIFSAFSETQVYLARVDTELGPIMRVYEFDRYNGTVWQVDMLISNGTFYAHPKITNPTDRDLRGYWWTCVAVPAKNTTRILSPAEEVVFS